MSLAESILAAKNITEEEMHIPEWGVTVLVRELSARGRVGLENTAAKIGGSLPAEQLNALVLARCVFDPATHKPEFTLEQATELVSSEEHAGAPIQRIVVWALTRSKLETSAEEDVTRNFSSAKTPTSSTTSSGTRSASRSSKK